MNPAIPYCSASNGASWKYPLKPYDVRDFGRGCSVAVEVIDSDGDFRWGIDLESSSDGGKTWSTDSTIFSSSAAAEDDKVVSLPAAGLWRFVLKVSDAQSSARVWGSVSVDVRR